MAINDLIQDKIYIVRFIVAVFLLLIGVFLYYNYLFPKNVENVSDNNFYIPPKMGISIYDFSGNILSVSETTLVLNLNNKIESNVMKLRALGVNDIYAPISVIIGPQTDIISRKYGKKTTDSRGIIYSLITNKKIEIESIVSGDDVVVQYESPDLHLSGKPAYRIIKSL